MIDQKEIEEYTKKKGREVTKKYGFERMKDLFKFIEKLNRYYSFPYSDLTLYDFAEDLEKFKKRDLFEALRILEDRESSFPLKFPEIKSACKNARADRKRIEEISVMPETLKPCPIPDKVKEHLSRIFNHDEMGAENE